MEARNMATESILFSLIHNVVVLQQNQVSKYDLPGNLELEVSKVN
jgi:hypothetical protein